MTITVIDSYSEMNTILRSPAADRADLLRQMFQPVAGMFRYAPGEVDPVAVHSGSFGFPLDRDEDRCLEALEALAAADAWARMRLGMEEGLAALRNATPDLDVPDITVLLVLGDPADSHFMGPLCGMGAFGGISGYIMITLWPFAANVARLEATSVHELHHNVRYGPGGVVWDPMSVTVGEQVVAEGLADAFARELHGDELGYARIGVDHLNDDEVFAKVVSGLDVTGMENFTAWIHGDGSAEKFGATPVGLPTGAGYAVGNRLVDTYLKATGQTAAAAVRVDSADIIATALGQQR